MPHQGVQEVLVAVPEIHTFVLHFHLVDKSVPPRIVPLLSSFLWFLELDHFISPVHKAAVDVHKN